MSRELEDKVAIVTGGSSGIGRSIAELFSSESARVAIADLNDSGVAQNIVKNGGSAMFVETDVRDASQVKRLVDACVNEFGALDILVNDAGVEQNRSITKTTEEEWDKIMDTNLKGVFLTSKYASPYLLKSDGGAIVNIASQLGLVALPGRSAYCASKAGVILLTKVLALEFAESTVRVNSVSPGPIQTPMLDRTSDLNADPVEAMKLLLSRVPLGRTGMPDEISSSCLVSFLEAILVCHRTQSGR